MPIPLETASTTYKTMSKILARRFRRRGARKQRLPLEAAELADLRIQRAEIDVRATVKDVFLEPRNPFDSQATRKPRRAVAFFGGLSFVLFAVFVVSSLVAR